MQEKQNLPDVEFDIGSNDQFNFDGKVCMSILYKKLQIPTYKS